MVLGECPIGPVDFLGGGPSSCVHAAGRFMTGIFVMDHQRAKKGCWDLLGLMVSYLWSGQLLKSSHLGKGNKVRTREKTVFCYLLLL